MTGLVKAGDVHDEVLQNLLKLLGVGAGAGAAARFAMGTLRDTGGYEPPKIPKPLVVDVPVPAKEKDKTALALSVPRPPLALEAKSASEGAFDWVVRQLGDLWPGTRVPLEGAPGETRTSHVPYYGFFIPPAIIGGAAGGYTLADQLTKGLRRSQADRSLDKAKQDYQKAVLGRATELQLPAKYAAACEAVLAGKPPADPAYRAAVEAASAAYDRVKYAEGEESSALGRVLTSIGLPGTAIGPHAALLNTILAGLAGTAGGYSGYWYGRDQSAARAKQKMMSSAENDYPVEPPVLARFVPVKAKPAPGVKAAADVIAAPARRGSTGDFKAYTPAYEPAYEPPRAAAAFKPPIPAPVPTPVKPVAPAPPPPPSFPPAVMAPSLSGDASESRAAPSGGIADMLQHGADRGDVIPPEYQGTSPVAPGGGKGAPAVLPEGPGGYQKGTFVPPVRPGAVAAPSPSRPVAPALMPQAAPSAPVVKSPARVGILQNTTVPPRYPSRYGRYPAPRPAAPRPSGGKMNVVSTPSGPVGILQKGVLAPTVIRSDGNNYIGGARVGDAMPASGYAAPQPVQAHSTVPGIPRGSTYAPSPGAGAPVRPSTPAAPPVQPQAPATAPVSGTVRVVDNNNQVQSYPLKTFGSLRPLLDHVAPGKSPDFYQTPGGHYVPFYPREGYVPPAGAYTPPSPPPQVKQSAEPQVLVSPGVAKPHNFVTPSAEPYNSFLRAATSDPTSPPFGVVRPGGAQFFNPAERKPGGAVPPAVFAADVKGPAPTPGRYAAPKPVYAPATVAGVPRSSPITSPPPTGAVRPTGNASSPAVVKQSSSVSLLDWLRKQAAPIPAGAPGGAPGSTPFTAPPPNPQPAPHGPDVTNLGHPLAAPGVNKTLDQYGRKPPFWDGNPGATNKPGPLPPRPAVKPQAGSAAYDVSDYRSAYPYDLADSDIRQVNWLSRGPNGEYDRPRAAYELARTLGHAASGSVPGAGWNAASGLLATRGPLINQTLNETIFPNRLPSPYLPAETPSAPQSAPDAGASVGRAKQSPQ